MCGILGAVGYIDHNRFDKALLRLSHRGPDQRGTWHNEQNLVHLGSQRLSIFDPGESAKQPFHYENLVLIFNGAIYNHLELRKVLQHKQYSFTTTSDTEVIAAAFLEWGANCVDHFLGMWSFAIWDTQKQRLFLSRDRFGQKPLYYYQSKEIFAFGSEIKALAPLMDTISIHPDFHQMKINPFDYESKESCLVQNIMKIPSGHNAWFAEGKLQTFSYWSTIEHLQDIPTDYKQQTAKFSELFLDAIELRTRADVKVSATLSGGVDSSAIMAGLYHLKKENISACTVSFPGTPLDEIQHAKSIAQKVEFQHYINEVTADKALDSFAESYWKFEEIYLTAPGPLMEAYHTIRNNDVKVSIDGHGADELFCGYDSFFFKNFHDISPNPFRIKEILSIYRNTFPNIPPQFSRKPVSFLNYVKSNLHEMTHVSSYLKEMRIKYRSEFKHLGAFGGGLYELFHHSILPTLLRNYDRYSMSQGVETRMPFLDHRLVSFVFSLPAESKLRNGHTKAILRDSVQNMMPAGSQLRTQKMGFQTPVIDWARNEWRPLLEDLMNSTAFAQTEIVYRNKVKKQMNRLFSENDMGYKEAEQIWLQFSPFLWEQYFFNQLKLSE